MRASGSRYLSQALSQSAGSSDASSGWASDHSCSAVFPGHASGRAMASTVSTNSGTTTSGRRISGRRSGSSASSVPPAPPRAAGRAGISAVSGLSLAGQSIASPLRSSLPRSRSRSSSRAAAVAGRRAGFLSSSPQMNSSSSGGNSRTSIAGRSGRA